MSKIISAILMILFIAFPEEIKKGALTGINNGIFILLPSIFPYMTISNIFLKTGAADYISMLIYKITNPIFRFEKNFSGAYLISLFCGYPTGARMACTLEKNGKREALRLFSFGNVPGFGFCVSFLGTLAGDVNTGVKIYLCFVSASIILNYIFSFFLKDSKTEFSEEKIYSGIALSVTESVKEATLAIISVIGYAVFFSSVSELIGRFINDINLKAYIGAFLEITAGVPTLNNIYTVIFFTGFSGLSVIFQSLSFKKSKTPVLFVIFARLLFAVLSTLIFYAITH